MVAADHRLLDPREKGIELVELPVRDRVVLVRMALGATQRQTQPHLAERAGAVHCVADDELLGVRALLLVEAGIAIEPAGDFVFRRRIGEQIACQLLDGELVEGQVPVVGIDDPVAPHPHLPGRVVFITRGVAEASKVEPEVGHLLAVARRGQQTIDELLIRIRRLVGEKGVNLGERRRQSCQVE